MKGKNSEIVCVHICGREGEREREGEKERERETAKKKPPNDDKKYWVTDIAFP